MKVLIVAGAGTSIELGVPGMVGLANEFLAHAKQWNVEPLLVEKLMAGVMDVEHLIEAVDRICAARQSLAAVGHDPLDFDPIDKIRAEVEWFVQHAAERVVARDAQLMWGAVLRSSHLAEIAFITTNYDRAIELAANAEGIQLDDGFADFAQGESTTWANFSREVPRPALVKLHGSTDWFSDADSGSPRKLRHPMPLFGRSSLRLADGQNLGSALVLPSREKLLTRAPYPRLSQAFLNAADNCNVAVFIGSSLRDSHIRECARSIAHRVTVFIVNPEGASYGVDAAVRIAQHASDFLVSTLPNALSSQDPVTALKTASSTRDAPAEGSLDAVRTALDSKSSSSLRCRAIDQLDERGVIPDPTLLRELLDDTDAVVARYSLGLVSGSWDRQRLIQAAATCRHAQNATFMEDLELLRKVTTS